MPKFSASRKLLAAFVAVTALSLCLGYFSSKLIKSPAQVAAESSPPRKTTLTAEVSTGTVVSSVVLRGKVTPGKTVTVAPTLPEGVKPIVTKKLVGKGDAVRPGASVMEIAYRPLFLLPGNIPMIRDLKPGMTGRDVSELQQGLKEVGWSVWDTDGYFGPSTSVALTNLYRSGGYTVVSETVDDTSQPDTEESSSKKLDKAESKKPRQQVVASMSEIAFVADLPGRVMKYGASVGAPITDVAVVLMTSPPTIAASADPIDADRLSKGMKVQVSGSGKSINLDGKIAAIGDPKESVEAQGFVVPITVKPHGDEVPLNSVGDDVQIQVDIDSGTKPGLIVPLSAIYARENGSTTVVKLEGTQHVKVRVRVETSGDGRAQITDLDGDRIKAGDTVVVGAN